MESISSLMIEPNIESGYVFLSPSNYNGARMWILAVCLASIGTSTLLTGKSLLSIAYVKNREKDDLGSYSVYLFRYFESYFISLCTLLSCIVDVSFLSGIIMNYVCAAAYAMTVLAVLAFVVARDARIRELHVVGKAALIVVPQVYAIGSTVALSSYGWLDPDSNAKMIGFSFLNRAACDYGGAMNGYLLSFIGPMVLSVLVIPLFLLATRCIRGSDEFFQHVELSNLTVIFFKAATMCFATSLVATNFENPFTRSHLGLAAFQASAMPLGDLLNNIVWLAYHRLNQIRSNKRARFGALTNPRTLLSGRKRAAI